MPKFNDLTGKTIGRLTFISHEYNKKRQKTIWIAKCQCGQHQKYSTTLIFKMKKSGYIFECGKCKKERNSPTLTDKIFGRLTVLKEVPGKDHHRWWLCRCECGVEKEINGTHLTKKKRTATKSCGCLARKLQSKWANTTQYPPSHFYKSNNVDELSLAIYNRRGAMLAACYNEKNQRYKIHGALGHTVCDLWRNGAKDFFKWCFENNYRKGDAIFLKDGKTEFNPENCFLMTRAEYRSKIWKKVKENMEK